MSQPTPSSPRRRHALRSRTGIGALAALAVVVVSLIALTSASGSSPTVAVASNSTLRTSILVNSQGRTLYVLSPETSHHLLCRSSECLSVWPPLTVPSRSTHLQAGSGVHGTLAILRRSTGQLQVTLNGLPLYRFSGDNGRGQVNGQGLKSFGGTWHALTGSGHAAQSEPGHDDTSSPAPGSGGGGSPKW